LERLAGGAVGGDDAAGAGRDAGSVDADRAVEAAGQQAIGAADDQLAIADGVPAAGRVAGRVLGRRQRLSGVHLAAARDADVSRGAGAIHAATAAGAAGSAGAADRDLADALDAGEELAVGAALAGVAGTAISA